MNRKAPETEYKKNQECVFVCANAWISVFFEKRVLSIYEIPKRAYEPQSLRTAALEHVSQIVKVLY